MSDDSDNLTEVSDSGEWPLVDSAGAQFEALARSRQRAPTDDRRGLAIPGYRILQEMHRGGQGVVYQAMQESTRRKVAIKVLKGGPLADPTELARFDREVDVLSRLKHRHIVAIHDRGLTSGGHAYYVMDYIPGRPLDAYVAGAALSSRDMLRLFHTICEAVNVAHLRGVIHRDLKPSNIRVDEENEPHILDFGLAKLTHDTSTSAGVMTITGQFVGSLPWSSPEQAEGRSDLLDVRTDVYSLGVILYQLLTRSFPYPVSGRMNEVVQNILHASPARPTSLGSDIERDIEVIVLKCLAKDPEGRYQSAGELARDIQHFLNGEPIEARPATSLYQLHQFARRNKALVTSVFAIIFILAAATTVSVAFAFREAAARNQTRAVADFQAQMLADIDAQSMGVMLRTDLLRKARDAQERIGRSAEDVDAHVAELQKLIAGIDLTGLALNALDENVFQKALAAIDKQFAGQPSVQARLLQTSAETLYGLGLYDAAGPPQEEALAIRRRVLGDDHPDTLSSVSFMGLVLQAQGKLAEAEGHLRKALEERRRVLGEENPQTLTSIDNMGLLLQAQGKLDQAEQFYREALEMRRRTLGDEHPETLGSLNNMGFLLQAQGKYTEAEPYFRESLEKLRRVMGDDDPNTLVAINNMGALLYVQGRLSEAEPYFHEAIDISRQVLGEEHHDTLRAMDNMSVVLRALGRLEEAEGFCRESMEKHRQVLGDEHPDSIISIGNMGVLLMAQGKLSEAEPYLRQALETSLRVLGGEHPDALRAQSNLGQLLQSDGRLAEAEPHVRGALEGRRRVLGDRHPDTLTVITYLGGLLLARGKLAEADPYLRQALEEYRRLLGDEDPRTLAASGMVGALLVAQGKPREAIQLLAPGEPAARRAFTGGNSVSLGRFLTALGCARAAVGEFDSAESALTEAYAIARQSQGATERDRDEVLNGLVELYDAWHATAPDEGYDAIAAEWRTKLVER